MDHITPAPHPGLRRMLRRRAPRGYTLLEVAVVMAIGAAVVTMITAWVMGLAGTARSGTDAAAARRDAAYAAGLLSTDTAKARPCSPAGLDAPIRSITPTQVGLHVPSETGTDLVIWRLADGRLQRAVVPSTGECTFNTGAAAFVTVATSVSSPDASRPVFATVKDGATRTDTDDFGDCDGIDVQLCRADAVAVDLTFTATGPDATQVPLRSIYPLTRTGSSL